MGLHTPLSHDFLLTVTTWISSLSDVARKLSDLAQENAFRRAINRAADADLIQDLNKGVDECIDNFMLGTQLSTGMDVKYFRELPFTRSSPHAR